MRTLQTTIKAVLLGAGLMQFQALAQETVTFDPASRQQALKGLELGSEVHMYHPVHHPDERSLILNLRCHNYTMCLKPDVEATNDNADPYVTDFTKFNPNHGGKAGQAMALYFPFLRECKRLTDSVRVSDPSRQPFTIGIRAGFYDRFVPDWLKSTAAGTSQVDSTQYAEYAEDIYYQCKTYKDSTGIDVVSIDPIAIANTSSLITPTNLRRLLDTLGLYLDSRGLHPELCFGTGMMLDNTTNQNLMLDYIRTVFSSPLAAQHVKRVDLHFSVANYSNAPDAYLKAVLDSSSKYGFEVRADFGQGYYNSPCPWAWNLTTSAVLSKALYTTKVRTLMFDAVLNSEVALAAMLWYDYQANTPGYTLDDPNTNLTAYRTPAYYYMRHLFGHTNSGASYVLSSSSTDTNVQRIVVFDTVANKVSVMLTNPTTAAISLRISSGAFNPGRYDVYRMSVNEVDFRLPSVNASDVIVLPATSTTVLTNDYVPFDVTPPAPPVLTLANLTPYSCDLTWQVADNKDALAFDVYDGATLVKGTLARWAYSVVGFSPQTQHTLTVRARDGDGNYSGASNAIVVTTPAVTRVVKEIWDDIPGGNMLTSQIPIATPPQRYLEIDSINSIHTESLSGERIRGYIVPPTTGLYRFYFASCAYGDFYLSTDTAAANKTRRAYFGTWNTCPNTNGWHDFAGQISDSINLVADRYYYFEILHKVWWQGALLQLAWTGPGITDTTILRTPYIRPYVLTGGMTGAPARAVSRNAGALSLSLVGGTATTRAPVVRFSLPSDQGHVVLTLNDLQGRTVRRLVDGAVASGVHVVAISDRSNAVAPGTYLLRLRAGTTVKSMTITLSR